MYILSLCHLIINFHYVILSTFKQPLLLLLSSSFRNSLESKSKFTVKEHPKQRNIFQDISSAASKKSPLSLSSSTIYKLSWITAAVKLSMTKKNSCNIGHCLIQKFTSRQISCDISVMSNWLKVQKPERHFYHLS